MESATLIQRVKEYITEKEVAKQATIGSSLKINPSRLNAIIGDLEREGYIEKRKAMDHGHQVNTVVLVKATLPPLAYKKDGMVLAEPQASKGKAMFDSPCFFCPKLETWGDDSVINYYNCPKLNEYISKPL